MLSLRSLSSPHFAQVAFITYGEADWTIAVALADRRYTGAHKPEIERREFEALKGKEAMITNGMRKYLAAYKKAIRYPNHVHYRAIRACSSLRYFHEELHIPACEESPKGAML